MASVQYILRGTSKGNGLQPKPHLETRGQRKQAWTARGNCCTFTHHNTLSCRLGTNDADNFPPPKPQQVRAAGSIK